MYSYKSWSYFNFEYVPSLLNLKFLWTFCASVFHFPVRPGRKLCSHCCEKATLQTPLVESHVPVRFRGVGYGSRGCV